MKPDFYFGFKNSKHEVPFFFVEEKRLEQICGSQAEDDFTKLMK